MLRIQYPLNGESATRSVAHCARGKRISNKQLWCNAPSRNYFCATEIAESKKGIFLFPLVEMLLSPKGTKPLEEF